MFRITEDPSSVSLVQCLAKNYKNDSIVSVDMDKVGVMAAYCDPLCCVQFTVYEGTHFRTEGYNTTVLSCYSLPSGNSSLLPALKLPSSSNSRTRRPMW